MVSFLVNALIILLIVDFAAYQLVKTLKKLKRRSGGSAQPAIMTVC